MFMNFTLATLENNMVDINGDSWISAEKKSTYVTYTIF